MSTNLRGRNSKRPRIMGNSPSANRMRVWIMQADPMVLCEGDGAHRGRKKFNKQTTFVV